MPCVLTSTGVDHCILHGLSSLRFGCCVVDNIAILRSRFLGISPPSALLVLSPIYILYMKLPKDAELSYRNVPKQLSPSCAKSNVKTYIPIHTVLTVGHGGLNEFHDGRIRLEHVS